MLVCPERTEFGAAYRDGNYSRRRHLERDGNENSKILTGQDGNASLEISTGGFPSRSVPFRPVPFHPVPPRLYFSLDTASVKSPDFCKGAIDVG